MSELPKITIGMTSFFAADTIVRAIESAFAQDYPNTEILIVDDCSKDNSVDIIKAAIDGHENARLIVHEVNTGFAGALNSIIQNATGEFIVIFDDDDVSMPNRLSAQYQRITEYEKIHNADLILCHTARTQSYENGLERYEKTIGITSNPAPHGEDVANRILVGHLGSYGSDIVGSCANCARMGRTSVFRTLGGFDSSMRRAEDTDFSIRFARSGGHFVGIETPLVHQQMTTGSEKTLEAEYKAESIVLQKHSDYLKKIGWYDFAWSWLEIRYAYFRNDWLKFVKLLALLFLKSPIKVIRKIYWSLPAASTRNAYKDWHQGKLGGKSL